MISCSWRLLWIRRATVQRLRSAITSHEPWMSSRCRSKICCGVRLSEGNQVVISSPRESLIFAG